MQSSATLSNYWDTFPFPGNNFPWTELPVMASPRASLQTDLFIKNQCRLRRSWSITDNLIIDAWDDSLSFLPHPCFSPTMRKNSPDHSLHSITFYMNRRMVAGWQFLLRNERGQGDILLPDWAESVITRGRCFYSPNLTLSSLSQDHFWGVRTSERSAYYYFTFIHITPQQVRS